MLKSVRKAMALVTIAHCTGDPVVAIEDSRKPVALFESAGIPVTFRSPAGDHTVSTDTGELAAKWVEDVVRR
ncbi:hypothetical protein JW905_17075 [bacterium]|nr:hypothetical protein [candidate division CSSED10-310 bacterium]